MKESSTKILNDFTGYMSLHGLGRIGDAKFWFKKLVWTLLFLGCLGTCTYQIVRLTQQYHRFQVNTIVEIQNEAQEFPGVAFCNLNPIRYSSLEYIPDVLNVITALSEDFGIGLDQFTTILFSLDDVDLNGSEPYITGPYTNYHHALATFQSRLNRLPTQVLEDSSQPSNEFVRYCKFHGVLCSESNFTMFRDKRHGLCYFLNSERTGYAAGRDSGLEVMLDIEQIQYVPFITESAGALVQIYDKNSNPNLGAGGFSVPIGVETNVGFTKKMFSRYPGPQGKCNDTNRYSDLKACIGDCRAKFLMKTCSCTDDWTIAILLDGIEICQSPDEFNCMLNVFSEMNEMDTRKLCPDCKVPCNEVKFEQTLSMATWPSENVRPILQDELGSVYSSAKTDLLLLRVYYSSFLAESITEEPAYTEENFVSDIGGQLGLWIGMSVLSMAEVLELIVLLIHACVRSHKTEAITPGKDLDKQTVARMTIVEDF